MGQPAPRGVAFHVFCRTTVTTIADEHGSAAAAEFTGRSVETVERVYKRKRQKRLQETAKTLDALRS